MASTAESKASQLLVSVGEVPLLSVSDAAMRLYAAYLGTSTMASLKAYFPSADKYSSNASFDGVDRKDQIVELGNAAMAYVLPTINDSFGFGGIGKKREASQVPDKTLNNLVTSVFAEHISNYLVSKQQETLTQLRNDSTVAPAFKALLTNKMFDPIAGRTSLNYARTLLFVYEYLVQGPDFQDIKDPTMKQSLAILQEWQSRFEVASTTSDADARITLAKYALVASAVLSPSGKASDNVQDVLQSLATVSSLQTTDKNPNTLSVLSNSPHAADIDAAIKRGSVFDAQVIEAYESESRRIWRQWQEIMDDQTGGKWIVGLRAAQNKQSFREWTEYVREGDFGIETGYRETTNGPELADWYRSNQKSDYMNTALRLNNSTISVISPIGGGGGSCFVGGTIVRTSNGGKAIESLVENDIVCTRLEPLQWGVRSCEIVQNLSPPFIYGFNDDQPFFTPGHVFHTTTGLRAIRPQIARQENPWIEVGQLAVGHHILRMTPNNTYEAVEIRNIHFEASKHKHVYGVHLREGLRSYHANGYLVALNYPEITISMIAKRLMALPPQTRLNILNSMYEIRPILQQFGAATALEVLALEAQSNDLSFGGKVANDHQFLARDVNMPYVIKYTDTSQYAEQVELRHGLLYIDGKRCPRVTFTGKSLTWSRELSSGEWEHAHCEFIHQGVRASGYIARSSSESTEKDITAAAKAFQLMPGTLNTMGVDMKTANSEMSLTAQSNEPGSASGMEPAVFPLVYDPQTYVSHEKTPPNATISCGNIILPPDDDDNDEYSWPMLQIEQYEKVRKALEAKVKAGEGVSSSFVLNSLYTHSIVYDGRDVPTHEYELTSAECLVQTSDEYAAWAPAHYGNMSDNPPSKNLHYTNLGLPSDFVIAEIFQSITIEQGLPDENGTLILSGVARSYSATSEAHEGPAHWIVGTYSVQVDSAAAISKESPRLTADASSPTQSFNVGAHAFASALAEINANDLTTIVNQLATSVYDQKKINDSSQVTMTNVMQWHMKDEDRKLFFGTANRPSGLPAELTTQLEGSDSAKWIRDVYANAYICQVLAKNDALLKDKYKFTDQEIKNIRYFWEGKGRDCLSQSQIYKDLERAIARYQTRLDNEKLREVYRQNRGKEVSDFIFKYFTQPTQVGRLRDRNAQTGTPLLTKLCAFADALDDGQIVERKIQLGNDTIDLKETSGNALVLYAVSVFKCELWRKHFLNASHEERQKILEAAWFENVLRDIITMILANDPKVTGQVAEEIRKAIAESAKEVAGWDEMSRKSKVELILKQFSVYIEAYLDALCRFAGWVWKAGKWVWEGGKRIYSSWSGNTGRVADTVDRIVDEKKPTGFIKGPLMKIVLVLGGLTMVALTIVSLGKGWENYSAADRGRMITTIFASVRQLAELSTDAVYAILRYNKKGAFSEAMELSIHAKFDYMLEREFGQSWTSLVESTNGKYKLAALENRESLFFGKGIENDLALTNRSKKYAEITTEEAVNRLGKMSEISKRFQVAQKVLAFMGYIISVAFAIFMTWQLIKDWGSMDVPTRIFELLQVILACIEGLFAAIIIVGFIAWGVALVVASTAAASIGAVVVAMASIFASVTIVLAFLALFVLVAYWIYTMYKEPPPNPVEQYVLDTGKPFAKKHPAAAEPIEVKIAPVYYPNDNNLQNVTVSYTNKSNKEQLVCEMAFQFASGPYDGCLFRDTMDYKTGDSFEAGNAKLVSTSHRLDLNIANIPHTVLKDAVSSKCRISANPAAKQPASVSDSSAQSKTGDGETEHTNGVDALDGFIAAETSQVSLKETVVTVEIAEANAPPDKEFAGFRLMPNESVSIMLYGKVKSDKYSECVSAYSYVTVEDLFAGDLRIVRGTLFGG